MKKFSIILGLVFTLFTTLCFNLKAEELATNNNNWYNNLYVGAGSGSSSINALTIKEKNLSHQEIDLTKNLDFFIGYNIHKYIALEFGYNHFLKNEHTDLGLNRKINGNNIYISSIFKYTIKEKHVPFILLGLGSTKIDAIIVENSRQQDREGLNYIVGAGYEYAITKNHTLGAKYVYNILPSVNYIDPTGIIEDWEKMRYTNINLYYKYNF